VLNEFKLIYDIYDDLLDTEIYDIIFLSVTAAAQTQFTLLFFLVLISSQPPPIRGSHCIKS
jgi:hypothetical protein